MLRKSRRNLFQSSNAADSFGSLAAFFADVQETPVGQQKPIGIPTGEQAAELRKIEERIAELKKPLGGKAQPTSPATKAACSRCK